MLRTEKKLAEEDVPYQRYTLDNEALARNKKLKEGIANLIFGGPPKKQKRIDHTKLHKLFGAFVQKLPIFPYKKFLTGKENSKEAFLFNIEKKELSNFTTLAKNDLPWRFAAAQLGNAKLAITGGYDT